MKRIFKSTLVIAMVFAMLFGSTISASAETQATAPVNETRSTASSRSNNYVSWLNLTTSWQTIATSTTGFGCNVAIVCSTTATDGFGPLKADVRMLDKSGNVLWSESKSCPGTGTKRIYECGSDVYKIQVKVVTGGGTAWAYETTDSPD